MDKMEFSAILETAGVKHWSELLGFDFGHIFASADEDKLAMYNGYKWMVIPHSLPGLLHGMLIHAVPPVPEIEVLPWEEWFVYNGENRHHVLYTVKHDECDSEVYISNGDPEHPADTFDRKWYFYNDKDMTPMFFRG